LASKPVEFTEQNRPEPRSLESNTPPSEGQRIGLLITDDDLDAANWLAKIYKPKKIAGLFLKGAYKQYFINERVIAFRQAALSEIVDPYIFVNNSEVFKWIQDNKLDGIITPTPIEGINKSTLQAIRLEIEASGKTFHTVRHWWDETLYPHATHGFFRFKKAIPKVLSQL
jgi:deoxyribodipyrimidine photo-lyase